MSHDAELHLEDLHVGAEFTSGTCEVTEAEIREFAARYDPQPFHLDDQAARSSIFGGLAASGWHTAAITMKLLVGGGLPLAGGIIGMGGQINWPAPLRPGSRLRAVTKVLELTPSKSKPDRGIALCRTTTSDQDGNAVQVVDMKVMVRRRRPAG